MNSSTDFSACDGSLQFAPDNNSAYQHCFHSHGALGNFGQFQSASQQGPSCRPSTQMFPCGPNDHFGFTSHGHDLGGDMLDLDQPMGCQVNQNAHYHFEIPPGTQHYFTNAIARLHSLQLLTTNESSGTTQDFSAITMDRHSMPDIYASNVITDDSSVLTPRPPDMTMQETSNSVTDGSSVLTPRLSHTTMQENPEEGDFNLIDAVTNDYRLSQNDVPMHSGLQTQIVCKNEPNFSTLYEGFLKFNSPPPPSSDQYISDMGMPDSTPRPDQVGHEEARVHICQWICTDEDEICGQQFTNPKLLWDHVVESHVETLQKTQHGYVCEWKGCDRRHRSDDSDKIGFHQKSKIKRHLETHTGSGR